MIKSANQVEARHLEDKIETIIEAKMIKSADQAEAKHLDEIKKMRAVINESDKKLDCVIVVKIAETMEEEKDRAYRKNNVIVYGIQESEEKEAEKRIHHDTQIMEKIAETLEIDGTKLKKLTRLGKRETIEGKGDDEIRPRPLKVVLDDEQSKNELLKRARYLKTTKFRNVYIVPDMTTKEREQRRMLVKERDARKAQGQDMVIYRGKLVTRYVKKDSD